MKLIVIILLAISSMMSLASCKHKSGKRTPKEQTKSEVKEQVTFGEYYNPFREDVKPCIIDEFTLKYTEHIIVKYDKEYFWNVYYDNEICILPNGKSVRTSHLFVDSYKDLNSFLKAEYDVYLGLPPNGEKIFKDLSKCDP